MWVCLFATHLVVQGKSHTTIRNYLNSLSTYGQLWGYLPLNLQNIFIHLTLQGILQMVHHVEFDHSI